MSITLTSRVRRTPDAFVETEVDGDLIFMDVGEERFYSLKDTGIRVWQLIDDCGGWTTIEALTMALCEEFKVDKDVCQRDVAVLLAEMKTAGLVELASDIPDGDGSSF